MSKKHYPENMLRLFTDYPKVFNESWMVF